MEHKLVTTPIDEKDVRYSDYLKTTDNPTWHGYQMYCGDLYNKFLNEALLKYANRNEKFLSKINHVETFKWLKIYKENEPKTQMRSEMGDAIFNAHLTISGCYNSLMMELSRDELDDTAIIYFLNSISDQKKVLEKSVK